MVLIQLQNKKTQGKTKEFVFETKHSLQNI